MANRNVELEDGEISLLLNALTLVTTGYSGIADKLEQARKSPPPPSTPSSPPPSSTPPREPPPSPRGSSDSPRTSGDSPRSTASLGHPQPPEGSRWTSEEDEILRRYRHAEGGQKLIGDALPHRTGQMIKGRIARLAKRDDKKDQPAKEPGKVSQEPTIPPGTRLAWSAPSSPMSNIATSEKPIGDSSWTIQPPSKSKLMSGR